MSCRKKSYGRFAVIQMESDNCRKGAEYVPVWKNDFTVSCLDVGKDSCRNPCDHVTPCHDGNCKKNCKKVASCVPGCGSSFSKPCHEKAVDDRKRTQPCGGKLTGRFPVIELGPEGKCNKPEHEHDPCSFLKPCHDIFKKIRSDCRGLQPGGREATGRFPFFKVNADGSCCKPEHSCFN